ncbi:TAXI family TRAP transporter solute-binding subunit [Bacillus lacus]|uniref:TAXI family TRAP transporter solute-binding subunit n=1 Tax=Metabacillus lacus TaxID=1983721 RepID=A0A7X2J2L9_9BACI|nr:TAXI family TRAP transporter solute-binding subunit [Metabacillus lacus]MRX74327.1 TAXI family TRAP transporter solute-binding subunit [Metabacillus lacus]
MKKFKSSFLFIMVLTLTMVIAACGGGANNGNGGGEGEGGGTEGGTGGETQNLSLLTGGTGGTYYPLGGQMGTIISDNTDANITPQTSGASAENMQALRAGEAELAFSQTDIASYALEGKEMFDGNAIDNVTAIATLYPETVQIVTTEESGINSIEDLKGKTVSVGAPGSGVNINAKQILEVHGMTFEDIKAQNLAFDESTDGIQSGNIHAAFITAGTPTGAVEALSAQNNVKVLSISDDKIAELIEKYPFYSEDAVTSGTYGLTEDVKTVAVRAMLVATSELDENLVYEMTKALFENTDRITHAKGELIKAETALDGVGDIPVHPGAQKYFDEQ